MIRIKRTEYLTYVSDRESLDALSMLVWCRVHFTSGIVSARSMNELRKKTHLHPDTIKKRLSRLQEMGLVELNGFSIRLKKLGATHTNRNIYLNITENDSIKDIRLKLYTYFLNLVNERKHYALSMTRMEDCHSLEEIKAKRNGQRQCKVVGRRFVDVGISYRYLSRKFGVARSTVQYLIKKAVKKGYVIKQNLFSILPVGISGAMNMMAYGLLDERRFTYISPKGFLVRVYGNRYTCTNDITDNIYNPTLINMKDISYLYIR